jgi:stage V sporulation protein G
MLNTNLDVRVYPIDEPKGNVLAFASVAADNLVVIHGIRVIDSEKGMFVSMPQSRDKDGGFHDIAFPLNTDLRNEISEAVINEYNEVSCLEPEDRRYGKPDREAAKGIKAEEVKIDVRVYPLDKARSNTKAFASVALDDMIAIRGVRVVSGYDGLYVSMPKSKGSNGELRDVAFPLNSGVRKAINRMVIDEYKVKTTAKDDRSLAEALRKNSAKAAETGNAPRESAAKTRSGPGVLE